ncbi:hypothetical protein RvY_11233-1 [Ramazzottius varieornatus]|uniref:Cystatin domain-containing protein n=1 Tax=Ramazzottius varieornatus TaxID=947166 RepID=A0A1D1VFG5_RAMVA|nr:hypothetical protein RvY_11233-1 [Ramazzottius varieornatus]
MLILQALCYRFCLLLMEIQIVQKAGLRTVSEFVVVRYTTQVVGGINYNLKIHIGKDKYVHAAVNLPATSAEISLLKVEVNKKTLTSCDGLPLFLQALFNSVTYLLSEKLLMI